MPPPLSARTGALLIANLIQNEEANNFAVPVKCRQPVLVVQSAQAKSYANSSACMLGDRLISPNLNR